MSFASILSEPAVERTPRKPSPPPVKKQPPPPPPPSQPAPAPEPTPIAPQPKVEKEKEKEKEKAKPAPEKRRPAAKSSRQSNANGVSETKAAARSRRTLSDRENERINRAMEKIDAMDKSDVEAPGFEDEWQRYLMKGKKRVLNTKKLEAEKRKVCRHDFLIFFVLWLYFHDS